MTSQKFWDRRTEKMNAELGKIPGYTQIMEQWTRQATQYDGKKDNVYIYNGDRAVIDERLNLLVTSKKHLFVYADKNSLNTFAAQAKSLIEQNNFEEAYAYLSNMKIIDGGQLYSAIAGILKTGFFRESHNDFFELSESLSYSMYYCRQYNIPENIKTQWISSYIRYFCIVSSKLFSECKEYSENWFIQTFLRVFHFAEILLSLSPIANFKKDEQLRIKFSEMFLASNLILTKLKNLIINDAANLNKIKHIESLLEDNAKTLKIKRK